MARNRRYKVTVEDESRLENVVQTSAPLSTYIVWCAVAVILLMTFGVLLLGFTPIKTLLPGYLKASERSATEEQHLRLDSLLEVYDANELFIANLQNVLNPKNLDLSAESFKNESAVSLSPDSLLPVSPEEMTFAEEMREKEKYNINISAPLAAESMLFVPLSNESVVTDSSKNLPEAEVVLAKGSSIGSIADGKVISLSKSLDKKEGNSIIIQHRKGFLSRISHLGTIMVKPGDEVIAGQTVAHSMQPSPDNKNSVYLEIWHNGNKLIPYQYIGNSKQDIIRRPVVDEDIGRGRL